MALTIALLARGNLGEVAEVVALHLQVEDLQPKPLAPRKKKKRKKVRCTENGPFTRLALGVGGLGDQVVVEQALNNV